MSRIDPQRELDAYLLNGDRRLSWAICIVIVAAYVCAFAFSEPGSPAAVLLAKATSALRG